MGAADFALRRGARFPPHRSHNMRALVLVAALAAAAVSAQGPNIAVTSGELSATLDVGESTSRAITISNDGTGPLTYRARTASGTTVPALYANAFPDGTIVVTDPSTGAVRSTFPSSESESLLAFDGGTLYALYGQRLRALDPVTGKVLSTVTLSDGPSYYNTLDVAFAGGRLAVLSNTYSEAGVVLDLYDTATGARARRIPLDLAARAVAAGDGVYYVSGEDPQAGQVLVTLDPASGERLRTRAFADVSSLTYSRSLGVLLASPTSYGSSRTVRVYDAATADFVSSFTLPDQGANGYSTSYRGLAADEGDEAPWLSLVPRSGTVAAGGQAGLTLNIDAARVLGGEYAADVIVSSNDPDEPEVTLPVSLVAVGVPKVAVRPASIDLGPLYAGTPVVASFSVSNPGSDTLRVASVTPSDDRLTVSPDVFDLLPGDSTAVEVSVTPTGGGDLDATVTLATNVEGQASVAVQVTAGDAFPPVLAVTPATVPIEGSAGETASATLTVSNTGEGPLEFEVFAGFQAEVRPSRNAEGRDGETAADPLAQRERTQARRTSASSPAGVDAPPLVLLADDADDAQAFDVLAVRGGVDGDSLYIAVDFETRPREAFVNVLLDTDTDPNTGALFGRLGVEYELVVSVYDDGRSGFVDVYEYGDYSDEYYGDSWSLDGSTLLFAVPLSALPELGEAFDAIVSADGYVAQNGASFYGYDGVPDEGIIAVQAVSASWLSASPESGTVAPGSSETVTITADATDLVGGGYQSSLIIEGNGPVRQRETVAVEFVVTGVPAVAADAMAFGQVYVGYPAARSLVVSNPGTDRLTVTAVTVDDDALAAELDSAVAVAPGGSVQIPISVTAAESGAFSGTLTVETDAPSGPLEVAVTASAVRPPVAALSVESVDLAVPIGAATEVAVAIENPGGVPLTYRANLLATDGEGSRVAESRVDTTPAVAASAARAAARERARVRVRSSHATGLPAAADLPTLYADPDEGLAHDVVEVRGAVDDDAGVLQLELVFGRAVQPYELGGTFLIDRDQDAQTGQGGLGIGNRQPPLGVEVSLDLGSVRYGDIYLYERVSPFRAQYLAASVDGNSVRFDVPLGYFGDGPFDFAGYVFHQSTNGPNTDYVPDSGAASVDARLSWLAVTPTRGSIPAGGSASLALMVDATELSFDTYRAQLLLTTNAPGAPSVTVPVTVEVVDNTSVEDVEPGAFALAPPVPNPTSQGARLTYALADVGAVVVTVFDAMGRRVLALDHGVRAPGTYTAEVDASGLPAGVYMVRLQAGRESAVRPLSVVR